MASEEQNSELCASALSALVIGIVTRAVLRSGL